VALELDIEQPAFDCVAYANTLLSALSDLVNSDIGTQITTWKINLDYFSQQITAFHNTAVALHGLLASPTISLNTQSQISQRMMFVERAFLLPGGLPNRPLARHAVFAPSSLNSYVSSAFPGIVDAVLMGDQAEVQRQIFAAAVAIQNAGSFLLDGLI